MTQLSAGLKRSIALNTIGIALVMLWLLSPLSSQAVLRILTIGTNTTTTSLPLHYLNVSNWSDLRGGTSDGQLALIAPNTLLNAALISPIGLKAAPQDLWNHVKIPQLSRMSSGRADPDGWYQVTANSTDDFSSLIGIPIVSLPKMDHRSINLSLESWYWDLECSPWQPNPRQLVNSTIVPTFESFQWDSLVNNGRSKNFLYPPFIVYYNDSLTAGNRATDACNADNFLSRTSVIDCPELGVRRIGIKLQGAYPELLSECQIRTVYVETEIFCSDGICVPNRIRESKVHHLQSNWTMLDIWTGTSAISYTVPSLFFNNFANSIAGRQNGGGGSNAMIGYIDNPNTPFSSNSPGHLGEAPDLQKIDDKLITSRFTQIMNTYWLVSIGSQLVMGTNGDFNLSATSSQQFDPKYKTSLTSTVLATINTTEDVLQCSVVWLTIFMLVTLIAFAAAVCGLAIIMMSSGPRLAMNISTVIRDNRYCPSISKGSYLDDNDRSRDLQNLTVRIGDVKPSESVGHIAISTTGTGDSVIMDRLRKRRFYD
ncbi:hypothetical protein EPUS_07736 [Endocarpon pusillum Z07020]|uniref:Uncharacterized protein n=1 Tax=Endocarpon pusillum (strain Z07020 / HMAS-L-300199) TaxID=1263415 RepID=U1GNM3_ENDPU|nr:uncharacterized protein EPUS_07736 [Endocarpon pusillum Z07020]ERF73531.1 hypothetical protein EPUS_07736 [Endocarpon pusillum Z07020]